jgi:hypothetical protein
MIPRIYKLSVSLAMFVVAMEALGAGRKWS